MDSIKGALTEKDLSVEQGAVFACDKSDWKRVPNV